MRRCRSNWRTSLKPTVAHVRLAAPPISVWAETARQLSRAEADRNLAQGKLETLALAVDRHKEDAMSARAQMREAEGALTGLGDLDSARAQVEDIKQTVEAARITMLTHRSTHDELRREGEARTRRTQEVTKDLSGWRHRLETAEKANFRTCRTQGKARRRSCPRRWRPLRKSLRRVRN